MASRRLALGSRVRVGTKLEAERVGKYMVRPVMAMERLLFLEWEGKVGYRHGQNGAELETMNYLEFIARVTSHIPAAPKKELPIFKLSRQDENGL